MPAVPGSTESPRSRKGQSARAVVNAEQHPRMVTRFFWFLRFEIRLLQKKTKIKSEPPSPTKKNGFF